MQDAEELAIAALTFLAQDGERMRRFLAITGIEPGDLRALIQASALAFFAAILDHLLTDERLLLDFAAHNHIQPESVSRARQQLMPDRPVLSTL